VDDSEGWEVDRVPDAELGYRKLHCVVQWAGYSHIRTSWEPAEKLHNPQVMVEEFHRMHTEKLRMK